MVQFQLMLNHTMIFCINEWQMINYLTIRTSLNKVGQCSFLYLIQPWPKDRKSFPSTIVQTNVAKQTALHCFALVTHNKTLFPITINLLCIVNLLKDISFFSFFFILFQLSLCSCIKYFYLEFNQEWREGKKMKILIKIQVLYVLLITW